MPTWLRRGGGVQRCSIPVLPINVRLNTNLLCVGKEVMAYMLSRIEAERASSAQPKWHALAQSRKGASVNVGMHRNAHMSRRRGGVQGGSERASQWLGFKQQEK